MKRIAILMLVAIPLFTGLGVAGDVEVDRMTMISEEEYTLTFDTQGEEWVDVITEGPIIIESVDENGDNVDIHVVTREVTEVDEATITFQTVERDERETIEVHPKYDPERFENIDGVERKAVLYDELEDTWVNQRVQRKQTDEGTLIVYEQRDPTKGDIDSETGMPEGEWVEVDVDEEGDPEWIFDTPNEALVYASSQANTRYGERTRWLAFSIGIVGISLVTQYVLIPRYRKREEENFLFKDEGGK